MTSRPNIVLVLSDQQRSDSLASYGNRFTVTPGTDAMAAAGKSFDAAFTPWPVCTPARGTMWTGVYPHQHKLIDNLYGVDNAFASHAAVKKTVFDHLREAGYLTAHFGKWHLGEIQPPFFDVWEESFNSRKGHWMDGKLDGEYRPNRQTDAAVSFLESRKDEDQPFAMVLSFYPPHDPYSAPERFYEPYRGKGVPFAGYYAAVSALDEDLGRIRAALSEAGLADNTVVIYFSDHGDTFFYRREGEHKFVCHDDAIHIPFIVEGPGIKPSTRSDAPIGLQDLAPTMLDFAEAAIPANMQGRSLKPLLFDQDAGDWRDDYFVQNITHVSKIEQRAIRTADWKLIASANGAHELYDLRADPEEELNVFLTPREDGGFERFKHYPDYAPVIAELVDRMKHWAGPIGDGRGLELADTVAKAIAPRLAALEEA
jgi:arylsulfatase A-like enzyme